MTDSGLPSWNLIEKELHVGQALAYLEQHYRDEVTLAQLERDLHLNRSYLSRLFRKVTGVMIFHYLYRRRINQAKMEFLLEPDRSVTDICIGEDYIEQAFRFAHEDRSSGTVILQRLQ